MHIMFQCFKSPSSPTNSNCRPSKSVLNLVQCCFLVRQLLHNVLAQLADSSLANTVVHLHFAVVLHPTGCMYVCK